MSQPYPVVPTPLALFDVLTGVFDPVAGTPPLKNGTGTESQRYAVSRAGTWNFITGAGGSGTLLNAGDEVIYIGGIWEVIRRGATGDYLLRDGTLPMTGPLDTDGHTILLRNGLAQGNSDASRALLRYVQIAAGTWATRTALLQIRARSLGDPATTSLLPGELASDILLAAPTLRVGINGAGDNVLLVGPTRQLELTGDQVATGSKTIRQLSFGNVGVEMHLPSARGDTGQALIQQASGNVVWGSVQLSADVMAIALTGGPTLLEAFNSSGPYVIGQSSLVFITWEEALYVWSGGPGTFGLGATPAQPEDIVGPILSFAGVAFATLAEAQDGTVTGKAVDPFVAAAAYLVKDGDSQTVSSNLSFTGNGTIGASWRLTTSSTLNAETGSRLTVQDAPRTGTAGLKDAVNRVSLDDRFQATATTLVAGKGVILDTTGRVDRTVLPFATPVDYHGSWSPLAPGTNLLRSGVAGGGCTPPASPGWIFYVSADGRWNFATGASDPSGLQLLAGMVLLFDVANTWFVLVTPGSGTNTNALPRDGSLPMTGNLNFATGGLKISGAGPATQMVIENVVLDGGTF
jgi:hypothetical protein